MKNSQLIKNGFYIKVNKKKSPKKENLPGNELVYEEKFQAKTFNIPKSIYFTETKQKNPQIKNYLNPIHKQIKLFKSNKSKEKSIKQNNTTPINRKYKRKIIHIENKNQLNMVKSQTQFPLNTKNYLSKSEKNFTKFKSFLNQKNINNESNKKTKKLTTKGNNTEQNSTINLSKKKFKNNFYYPNLKYMQFHVGNKLIGIQNYSKTIMNNNSQSKARKKIAKKIKNKSKEKTNVKKYEKNIIDIYKSKLITIFVKLMNDYFKKKIKKIFNLFIYKIKDNFYFIYANKTYNKNNNNFINKKIYENEIYEYNTKINYQNNFGNNLINSIFPDKDYQSMTMYHLKYNKNKNNNKNIYIPVNNRYEENIIQNNEEFYNNYNSNDKYNIFKNMKIEKNPKNILNNNNIYKNQNQNINNQINNYYNTKNTNYYFNKINSFNSLIIEKQRPRYINPKNNIGYISPRKINNFSLNKKNNTSTNIIKLKPNIKNDLINSGDKSKNLIYKKILSKKNKNRINHEKYDIIMNQTERLLDKKNTFVNFKNIINRNNLNNYFTSINQYQEDHYNIDKGDISNDLNNYCLEDIDQPMNMIYSIYDFEREEEDNNGKNNNQNKINDKISMNFNYFVFQPKKKGKEFIYKNKIIHKRNQLSIVKVDSILFLNKDGLENKIKINLIIEKIKNIINNLIYTYKLKFFQIFKYIKFKCIICEIIENRKIDIIKKYFDAFKKYEINKRGKKNTKSNTQENIDLKISQEEKSENNFNINNETETIYYKKIELFRINILKFIFSKK